MIVFARLVYFRSRGILEWPICGGRAVLDGPGTGATVMQGLRDGSSFDEIRACPVADARVAGDGSGVA